MVAEMMVTGFLRSEKHEYAGDQSISSFLMYHIDVSQIPGKLFHE